jgi:hypothetical protein
MAKRYILLILTFTFPLIFTSTSPAVVANVSAKKPGVNGIYPWSAIGFSQAGAQNQTCTAFLIGPDLVLTANHCVSNDHGDLYGDIRIQFRQSMDTERLYHAVIVQRPSQFSNDSEDWAVLRLSSRVGDQLGYFGLVSPTLTLSGFVGKNTRLESSTSEHTCQQTSDALAPILKQYGEKSWVYKISSGQAIPSNLTPICSVGFPGAAAMDGLNHYGTPVLMVSDNCVILGHSKTGIAINNCELSDGESGGPVFFKQADGTFAAIGVNSMVSSPTRSPYQYSNGKAPDNYSVAVTAKNFIDVVAKNR